MGFSCSECDNGWGLGEIGQGFAVGLTRFLWGLVGGNSVGGGTGALGGIGQGFAVGLTRFLWSLVGGNSVGGGTGDGGGIGGCCL